MDDDAVYNGGLQMTLFSEKKLAGLGDPVVAMSDQTTAIVSDIGMYI